MDSTDLPQNVPWLIFYAHYRFTIEYALANSMVITVLPQNVSKLILS